MIHVGIMILALSIIGLPRLFAQEIGTGQEPQKQVEELRQNLENVRNQCSELRNILDETDVASMLRIVDRDLQRSRSDSPRKKETVNIKRTTYTCGRDGCRREVVSVKRNQVEETFSVRKPEPDAGTVPVEKENEKTERTLTARYPSSSVAWFRMNLTENGTMQRPDHIFLTMDSTVEYARQDDMLIVRANYIKEFDGPAGRVIRLGMQKAAEGETVTMQNRLAGAEWQGSVTVRNWVMLTYPEQGDLKPILPAEVPSELKHFHPRAIVVTTGHVECGVIVPNDDPLISQVEDKSKPKESEPDWVKGVKVGEVVRPDPVGGFARRSNAVEGYSLAEARPNPLSESATIAYTLPEPAEVTLEVFAEDGRRVAVLKDGELTGAGTHDVVFNADDLPAGRYLYRMTAGRFGMTKTLSVLR